ncbi:MAG: tail fiber protein [Okeania sp. SIO2D1]|nr:tail fiber protein [Okeania sp. SIO2D1]
MNKKRILGAVVAILLSVTLIFGTQVNSASAGEVPIGTITAYGGLVNGSAKGQLKRQGWLVCDGEAYSRGDYQELYAILGGSFGNGDNVTSFNVPDFRGRFLRGVDHGAGRDPDATSRSASARGGNTGDQVGSYQEDIFKAHKHDFLVGGSAGDGDYNTVGRGNGTTKSNSNMFSSGGKETRSKNIYVNWIIKAKDVD